MGWCQLGRYLFQVTLGYLDQRCKLIPDYRSGLYQSRQRPLPIASEVSGIILELPSDPSVLENSDFKSRGFKKGGHVAIVSSSGISFRSFVSLFMSAFIRTLWAHSRSTLRWTGKQPPMLYQTRFLVVSLPPRSFKASQHSRK